MRLKSLVPLSLVIAVFSALTMSADPPHAAIVAFPSTNTAAKHALDDAVNDALDPSKDPRPNLKALMAIDHSSLRLVGSKKAESVGIYCFFSKDASKTMLVNIDETRRDPIFFDQLQALATFYKGLPGTKPPAPPTAPAEAAVEPTILVEVFEYALTFDRATVAISAELSDEGAGGLPSKTPGGPGWVAPKWIIVFDFTNGGGSTNADATDASALTGAREPWSISADVPLRSIGDVKFSDNFDSAELKNTTPDTFYAGFNYAPTGDALQSPFTYADAINFKGLIKASRRPLDSFGLGIGLRSGLFSSHPNLPPFLKIFDMISPYVAYTRTRGEQQKTDTAGNTTTVRFKRYDWVVGLSFDISKAADFVKAGTGGSGSGSGN